jgi:hypothetical protein
VFIIRSACGSDNELLDDISGLPSATCPLPEDWPSWMRPSAELLVNDVIGHSAPSIGHGGFDRLSANRRINTLAVSANC